jgi:hypothetical protein
MANIVHLSPTPLVLAPEKIVSCINLYSNHQASLIVEKDYPGLLKNLFINNAILLEDNVQAFIRAKELVKDADLIHIHNSVSPKIEQLINESKPSAKFIYHTHSNRREGPLFIDQSRRFDALWNKKLAVSQHQPRMSQDYNFVPNIITFSQKSHFNDNHSAIPRIIHSPTHKKTGARWGDKVCKNLDSTLSSIKKLGIADVITASGLIPYTLFEIRKSADISIDEIVTCSFHQISLEGLAAGNAVINNADFFSKDIFRISVNADIQPPFVQADKTTIKEKLLSLCTDKILLNKIKLNSLNYFNTYLKPERLVLVYIKHYEEIL